MGLFRTILGKLGMHDKDEAAHSGLKVSTASVAQPTSPATLTQVDVVTLLETKAKANPQKLNWRTSIVDLLKLLDIDSSLVARQQLATELGCPPELMKESAQMNTWLHKTVLAKIAANGGNVPRELLD